MNDSMTWKALLNSEVFTEYLNSELKKEAEEVKKAEENIPSKVAEIVEREGEILDAFADFESMINKNNDLKEKFKKVKAYIIQNQESIKNVDPNFINGIMMLNIEDE